MPLRTTFRSSAHTALFLSSGITDRKLEIAVSILSTMSGVPCVSVVIKPSIVSRALLILVLTGTFITFFFA